MKSKRRGKYSCGFQRQLPSTIVNLTEISPSFGISEKMELILWPYPAFASTYPHVDVFDPPEGYSTTHGAEPPGMGKWLQNHKDFKHKSKLYTYTSPLLHPH